MKNRFKASLAGVLALLLLNVPALADDDYSRDWGPAAGTPLPLLSAPDQGGTTRTLADLTGRKGLLLLLVRSADW
ncbi:MAG: hypothetical protein AAGI15_01135 [Pseudomonadota bacterium]